MSFGHPPPIRALIEIGPLILANRNAGNLFQGYLGGVVGTLVDVSQNFWNLVDVFFPKNGDFSKFSRCITKNTQKSIFSAFLLTNFPKFSKKSAQKFSNFEKNAQKFFATPSVP